MTSYPWTSLLAALVLLCVPPPGLAQDRRPSGTVIIESTSVGLGVGVSWGDGRLTYRGKEYRFSLRGLSVVDLGVSRVGARGEVYGLTAVDDFAGRYAAAVAGGSLGAGAGAAVIVNPAGVTIALVGVGKGVRLVVGAEGIQIALRP